MLAKNATIFRITGPVSVVVALTAELGGLMED